MDSELNFVHPGPGRPMAGSWPARVALAVAAAALTIAAALLGGLGGHSSAFAAAAELRAAHGYSVLYLPQIMMEKHHLIEKQLVKSGLGETKVVWRVLDGGNVINDAPLAGASDIAAAGTPAFRA
jgi:NitT/TauT family transport system substrate-binding protein